MVKTETKIIIFLLVLAPVFGELLSGSMPSLLFFNLALFPIALLLYGCGALLIREAKARWKLQWSVIFLAVAYGIIEEGIMIHSFFNTGHVDLGALSGYAMYLGVQWAWTIGLIMFHATSSTLIPIFIIDSLFPKHKDKSLLKKRGVILTFIGFLLIIIAWIVLMVIMKSDKAYADYSMNIWHMVISILVVFLLIWLVYKYKTSRIKTKNKILPSFIFGLAGFLFMSFVLFGAGILAALGVPGIIAIVIQLFVVLLTLLFVKYEIYNKNTTKKHIVALITGTILFWIFLTPIYEFFPQTDVDPTRGMLAVGITALILLILWRRKVLK